MVDGMSDIISITMCCSHLVISIMLVKTKQVVEELVRPLAKRLERLVV